jgi:flagellar basal body L-ring protein FlgH
MKNIIILSILFLITSCGNMVAGYYKELDGNKRQRPVKKTFAHLKSQSATINSANQRTLLPPTKRLYVSKQNTPKRRMIADNFHDSDNAANLWNQPNSADLYTLNSALTSGDIVIINVLGDLKTDIASELKRAFALTKKKKTFNKKKTASADNTKSDPTQKNNDDDISSTLANKVYDRISSIVVDNISNDYVTIRGRKELLFRNQKHSIEIQALVNKKDISQSNYVTSDSIIEKNIKVLY